MRSRLSFVPLLAFLAACTFQSQVLKPDPQAGVELQTSTPFFSPSADSTAFHGVDMLTATPSVPPTFTPTATLTSTPVPIRLGTVPIRFAPGGTYLDIVDGISFGTSKVYSVSALQGQVMSVSVNTGLHADWMPVPIRISGADGAVLCPREADGECATFWRGTLPATQDYLIELTPLNDIRGFTLRVAVNPPGATNQIFHYRSPVSGASFSYTDEFAPGRLPPYQSYKTEPEISLSYIDTQAFVNTNLFEAQILYGASKDPVVVGDCLQASPVIPNEKITGEETVNGRRFVRFEGGGAATGNFYEQIIYRTVDETACHELVLLIHSFSTGAFLPQIVIQEFDRPSLVRKFESILSTLVIQ